MRRVSKSSLLLLAGTSVSLVLGLLLASDLAFMAGAAIGFGLSLRLVWTSVREGEIGSDILALIAIIATSLTGEWIAASIIALMLATGRALESWAAGRARSQLEALAQRAPKRIQLVSANGTITDSDVSEARI
ncbi:MAG: hypothetical protein RLZZ56_90, partial [Actinomycetota bacterium]